MYTFDVLLNNIACDTASVHVGAALQDANGFPSPRLGVSTQHSDINPKENETGKTNVARHMCQSKYFLPPASYFSTYLICRIISTFMVNVHIYQLEYVRGSTTVRSPKVEITCLKAAGQVCFSDIFFRAMIRLDRIFHKVLAPGMPGRLGARMGAGGD